MPSPRMKKLQGRLNVLTHCSHIQTPLPVSLTVLSYFPFGRPPNRTLMYSSIACIVPSKPRRSLLRQRS